MGNVVDNERKAVFVVEIPAQLQGFPEQDFRTEIFAAQLVVVDIAVMNSKAKAEIEENLFQRPQIRSR